MRSGGLQRVGILHRTETMRMERRPGLFFSPGRFCVQGNSLQEGEAGLRPEFTDQGKNGKKNGSSGMLTVPISSISGTPAFT